MSGKLLGTVLDRYPAADGEFKLAMVLANYANEEGRNIFPSVATMASKSRQDVRSVQRHLKKMLEIGWLLKVRPWGGCGRPAEYRINPRWLHGDELPIQPLGLPGPAQDLDEASACQHLCPAVDTTPVSGSGDTGNSTQNEASATPVSTKDDIGVGPYKNHNEPNTPLPPMGDDRFEELCGAYPRHRVKYNAALRRWKELDPPPELQGLLVSAAKAQAARPEWQARQGQHVPNLSSWILNRGWLWTHDQSSTGPQIPVSKMDRSTESPPASDQVRNAHLKALKRLRQETAAAMDEKRLRQVSTDRGTAASFPERARCEAKASDWTQSAGEGAAPPPLGSFRRMTRKGNSTPDVSLVPAVLNCLTLDDAGKLSTPI